MWSPQTKLERNTVGKLREYFYIDRTYLFDEDNVPTGAKLVEVKEAPKPANKARTPKTKSE